MSPAIPARAAPATALGGVDLDSETGDRRARTEGGVLHVADWLPRFIRSGDPGILRVLTGRRGRNLLTLGIFALGPVLVLATLAVLGPVEIGSGLTALRVIFLLDLVYVLVLLALVVSQVLRLVAARRARSAGTRLHLRLIRVFALLALLPAVTVAVFAGLTVNIGLEGWFSERVQRVLGASLSAAETYEAEHRQDLGEDAVALAGFIDESSRRNAPFSNAGLRQVLAEGQGLVQRGLSEAYVIDGEGELRARGERSYLFNYVQPDPDALARAAEREIVIMQAWDANQLRALVRLESVPDGYLYVTREIDGDILGLLDETQETVRFYQQLERDRGRVLFEFGLVYLGFAAILIMAAIWLGLWFAGRLSRPVGRLTTAAQRVASGDLDVQVPHDEDHDEISTLSRFFNDMTRELKRQRQSLLDNTEQIETRRRLFDSVLSSVTSGVVGLDRQGRVTFANPSATRHLGLGGDRGEIRGSGGSGRSGELGAGGAETGAGGTASSPSNSGNRDLPPGASGPLAEVIPEFAPMFEELRATGRREIQGELRVSREGRQFILLVRMATRDGGDGRSEGYVIAFDDVTNLVSAQRMAAWGDVARRIAHEIKNPLTPIQLGADRISRKFGPRLETGEAAALEAMTDVIVRQTEDLRRIVDEFSKFARMPDPVLQTEDLRELVRRAVLLRQQGEPGIEITTDLPGEPILAEVDSTMIGQALTNLLKNAVEAIGRRRDGAPEGWSPAVEISLRRIDSPAAPRNGSLGADGVPGYSGGESRNATARGAGADSRQDPDPSPAPDSALARNAPFAEIRIRDSGPGLPEDRSRLFEPYFTTHDQGTGLGLPIVKKIVEEHGGDLVLEDFAAAEGAGVDGAVAIVRLPVLPVLPEGNGGGDRSASEGAGAGAGAGEAEKAGDSETFASGRVAGRELGLGEGDRSREGRLGARETGQFGKAAR